MVNRHTTRHTHHIPRFTIHVLLYLLFAASASNFASALTIDYVIAVVNGQAITMSALENELVIREMENPSLETKRKVLEDLIDRELMLQEAERWGIPLARWDDKVEEEIQRIRSKYSSEALFLDDLKKSGLELQGLKEWLRKDFIVKELIARQWEDPLRSQIDEIQLEQEANQSFQENQSEWIEPMQLKFQYVLVLSKSSDPAEQQAKAKQLAETISSRLQKGATFRDIQQIYNDNQSLLIVQEPQTVTADTRFGMEIAKLETNEVSQPILISDGYLIAKLLDKKPARQKSYQEVSQDVKEKLIQQKVEKQIQAWLREQKESGEIRILDQELAQVQLKNTATDQIQPEVNSLP